MNSLPVLMLVILALALSVLALRRIGKEGVSGEAGLVLFPSLVRPTPLSATVYGPKKARFDTRGGGRLMARIVGSDDEHLFLRRGNGSVFRRLRAD